MTKNPLLNALGAGGYILLISSFMNYVSQTQRNKPDTFFAPVIVLSLFTLSAAIMGYIFFYQPAILLIDGKKKQALDLFLKTVGIFAAFTVVAVLLLLTGFV